MSQVGVLCNSSDKVECSNCVWRGHGVDLEMISDFEIRVSAGETVPAGQCPKCGALAHLAVAKSKTTPWQVAICAPEHWRIIRYLYIPGVRMQVIKNENGKSCRWLSPESAQKVADQLNKLSD